MVSTGARMLEDALVVLGALSDYTASYTALSDSQVLLETLKTELDKKILALKHVKLETGSVTTKYITSYH